MKKLGKIILFGIGGIILLVLIFGGGSNKENKQSGSLENSSASTKTELMSGNNPNVKRLNFATADYVGQSFDLYAMATVSDYYNYGFDNEDKYYSFVVWDSSVDSQYEGSYAYIDKNDENLKGKELFDLLLDDSKFLELKVSIPTEKYSQGSNAFLEIEGWEEI